MKAVVDESLCRSTDDGMSGSGSPQQRLVSRSTSSLYSASPPPSDAIDEIEKRLDRFGVRHYGYGSGATQVGGGGDVDELYGLGELPAKMAAMVARPLTSHKRVPASASYPAPRKLYIQSTPGTGVHTFLHAFCAAHSVNLLVVNLGCDACYRDELWLDLLAYALKNQPCLILLDRIDYWWRWTVGGGDGIADTVNPCFAARGERLYVAYQRSDIELEHARVWLVFSTNMDYWERGILAPGIRTWIGPNQLALPPPQNALTPPQRELLFRRFIRRRVVDLLSTADSEIEEIMGIYEPHIVELARLYPDFTVGMVHAMVRRLFEVAAARSNEPNDGDGLPRVGDFKFVRDSIGQLEKGMEGTIQWKR